MRLLGTITRAIARQTEPRSARCAINLTRSSRFTSTSIIHVCLRAWCKYLVPNSLCPVKWPWLHRSFSIQKKDHGTSRQLCIACGKPLGLANSDDFPHTILLQVICRHCKRIQPPPSVDREGFSYFGLLGHPVSYQTDLLRLKQAQLVLQRKLHPDQILSTLGRAKQDAKKFGQPTDIEWAGEWSRLANLAYEILADPLRRSIYLYELATGQSYEEDMAILAGDDEFDHMLEYVFSIQSLLSSPQNSISLEAAKKLAAENKERLDKTIDEMNLLANKSEWALFRRLSIHLKYLYNIKEACIAAIERLTEQQ